MKGPEKELGRKLKPTREEITDMRSYFEGQLLAAALVNGHISPIKYESLTEKRLNLKLKK